MARPIQLKPKRIHELLRSMAFIAPQMLRPRSHRKNKPGAGNFSPVGGTMQIRVSKQAGMKIRTRAQETGRTIAQVIDDKDY